MRQEHRAGEKLFVDFAGRTVPIVNPVTGVITQAELFVAALSASNYMYAEALPSQELPHWIAAHVNTVLPRVAVCDNLRSGVTRAHRYEPLLNATYQEMATHYGVAVLPARAYKPRDKAKIEVGVLIAERWIMARLRNRTFFSLVELNLAIRELVEWLNNRPFGKMEGCRRSLFDELEPPVMRPLPAQRWPAPEGHGIAVG
jgi:transposase